MKKTKQIVDDLLNDLRCQGVEASVIVDLNGIVVSSCVPNSNAETFGALSAVVFRAAEIAATETGIGKIHRVIAESKNGTFVTSHIGPDALLTVLAEQSTDLENAYNEIKKNTEQLKAMNDSLSGHDQ